MLGLVATAALGVAVGAGAALAWDAEGQWVYIALLAVAVGGLLGVAATALVVGRREGERPGVMARRLLAVWADPPRDWLMFLLGAFLFLPAIALYTRVLVGDSDSARIIASTMYVQRNGFGYLVDTQETFLPHLVLGPLLAVGGIPAAKVYGVFSLLLLAGTVSFIGWKLTRSALAATGSALALAVFSPVWDRATQLPMYQTMLALGLLGVYLSYRATRSEGREQWLAVVAAGLCLVLSIESHRIGQLFLVFPLLLLVTARPRAVLPGLARVYLATAVFYVPRAVVNLWEGGFDRFLSNRVDFWITEGRLLQVHENYFDYPVRVDVGTYLTNLVTNLDSIGGEQPLAVFLLAVIAGVLARGPKRRFAVACFLFLVAAVVYSRIPLFPRYFLPLMTVTALAAGAAIPLMLRRSTLFRVLAVLSVLGLVVAASRSYLGSVDRAQLRQARVLTGPIPSLVATIDDGKGVIGARVGQLLFVTTSLRTYGAQFLSEREYVTYLTWPSDRAVIDVLQAHDIGWVLISPRLEVDYNDAWLVPAYGKRAQHVGRVGSSPSFCLARRADDYSLYKLGPCPA